MRILFSPVGGTDPISQDNGYEGALMQISRYWKPDIICLYMSKEILENQEKDGGEGRYLYCLHKLENAVESRFDIHVLPRKDLEKVQLFDPVYKDFEKILTELNDKMMATDELLLNISSGTPAMKSALLVLATMLDVPAKCIQVDTPNKKMNDHIHEGNWELEDFWDFDLDKEPGSVDRTHAEELPSLKILKYEENIKEFVDEYDFEAALKLAESLNVKETAPYIKKLRLANARRKLDSRQVNELIKQEDKNIYRPYGNEYYRDLYEYILDLQVKVKRREYTDFIRGLSPIFVRIFTEILKKQTGFNLDDYSFKDNSGTLKWRNDALAHTEYESILENAYSREFKGGFVSTDHLYNLIDGLVQDENVKQCVGNLRTVEKNARNFAAHNISPIDDIWIQRKTGFTSEEIIKKIHLAVGYTGMNVPSCLWDSYDDMKEDIVKAMEPVKSSKGHRRACRHG